MNNLTRSPPVIGWYGVQNSVNSGNCTAWTVAQVQAGLAPGCTVVTDSNGFQYTAYSNQAYAVWLDYPWALALDAARGKLYASDGYGGTSANNIRTISLADGFTDFLAGGIGAGVVDAVGTAASFRAPSGLALDSAGGRLFVADTGNNKIRVISLSNANVTTWAGGGGPVKGGNTGTESGWLDGENVNAMFNQPYGIAFEASTGNLYVADYGNNKIRRIDRSGYVSTLAGSGLIGTGNGEGTSASLYGPRGVVLDGFGTLFVSEWGSGRVRSLWISPGDLPLCDNKWHHVAITHGEEFAVSTFTPLTRRAAHAQMDLRRYTRMRILTFAAHRAALSTLHSPNRTRPTSMAAGSTRAPSRRRCP